MWKVAIIEDDRVDREIYKRCLRLATPFEFDFAEAGSAGEGIELSRQWSPDCILLDFHLPDMDGLEVLRQLRGQNDRAPCAIVMLTACGGEELAVNAMKSGAMDYLPKGQVSAEVLAHTAVNAIERFQMLRRMDEQRAGMERSARQYQNLLNAIPQMVWMADTEGHIEYANGQWFEYTGRSIEGADPVGRGDLLHPEDRERTSAAWTQARRAGSAFEIEHRLRRAKDGSYRWHMIRAIPFRDDAGRITGWLGSGTDVESQKQAEAANLQSEKQQIVSQLAAGIGREFDQLLTVMLGGASQALENLPPAHTSRDTLQDVVRAGERAVELTRKMLAYAGQTILHMEPTDLNKLVRETCDSLQSSVPQAVQIEISTGRDLPPVATDSRQMQEVIADLLTNALEAIREGSEGTISVRTARKEVGEGDVPALRAGKYVELEVLDTGCGMNEETQKKIFDPFFTTKFTGRGLGLAAVQRFVRRSGGGVDVDSAPGKGTRFRILLPAVP